MRVFLDCFFNIFMASCVVSTETKQLPAMIYGTAWKKDRTADLVVAALKHGFRAIDTACQPKHYNEAGVGDGLERFYAESGLKREDLFLQTKFTSVNGQDPTSIPYDDKSPLTDQVFQSFERSCSNLKTPYLDSLLLHSPMSRFEDTLTVWRAFETLHRSGRVLAIGLSNTYDIATLRRLYDLADVKPAYLQNRFYSKSGYDQDIRAFCTAHNIQYQSFWSLTANKKAIARAARRHGQTTAQVFYRYLTQLGIHPLSGTTSETHMMDDVAVIRAAEMVARDMQQGNSAGAVQLRGSVENRDAWELSALECSEISQEIGLA